MDFEFWENCWQRDSQPFHVAQAHSLLLKHFRENFNPDEKILVPLSGKTVDTLFLAKQGFYSVAVEFNPTAVQKFFVENHLDPDEKVVELGSKNDIAKLFQLTNIDIWQADFFALHKEVVGQFRQVYDRASFVALPIELRQKFAQHLQSLLLPDSVILMITMDYDPNQMSGPPFHVTQQELELCFPTATISEIDRVCLMDNHPRWKELDLDYLDEVLYLIQIP
ncbi:MAG: thiopurine S-methyltransferase [Kangiellaceae bacterium]|nr:thiopurine S-methyltransferase [Kangiellaceae bacterium]